MKRIQLLSMYILGIAAMVCMTGCKKDSYYEDKGIIDPKFNGTVIQYLQSNRYHLFDSLVRIIKLSGMENVFQNEQITFFAPADPSIINSLQTLNSYLLSQGRDTISNLAQLHPDFLKQQLSKYLFKGMRRLSDYPQLDPNNFRVYGGQYYTSYMGKNMLIGAVFYDAGGVQYAGYRQLYIGYPEGDTPPAGRLPDIFRVATTDINPTNGIVHALNYSDAFFFGFSPNDFVVSAQNYGFDYSKK
ncbi:hypothetical protein LL912_23595 [Niabella sp. CC-SYL272]|uniref:hypothetical protein n=1 Tax=Niabella agricola TaxID=2891571 RepID=UPI001F24E3DD|nr:hypothetical protein [Niabella agricola]MCF3111792.1 hypothetical protein [Niabella agricola]